MLELCLHFVDRLILFLSVPVSWRIVAVRRRLANLEARLAIIPANPLLPRILSNEFSEYRRLREMGLGIALREEDLVELVQLVELVVVQEEPLEPTQRRAEGVACGGSVLRGGQVRACLYLDLLHLDMVLLIRGQE